MIYTSVPSLNDVRIEKIAITLEGDQISIGFDMPFYSDKPPIKWVEQGCATTFVEIDFSDIKEVAIKSDNNGLRKSGIYLAGKHSVSEVSETLVEQLDVETDPSLRILIIRVLYIIDNDRYIDEIYKYKISNIIQIELDDNENMILKKVANRPQR